MTIPDVRTSVDERRLIYIEIIHTSVDMGTLDAPIRNLKLSTLGRHASARSTEAVDRMWDEIEKVLESMSISPGQVRLYQDGLPVCGYERKIVTELAEAGSRNHKLLLTLQSRGALLMGTESPELLIEEYQLVRASLSGGRIPRADINRNRLRDSLLERRDRFVADRINQTLGRGETAVLFMGMLHRVQGLLDPDIRIIRSIGQAQGRQNSDKPHGRR